MREGRCFRCRQTGHMSRNCPKNTDTRRRPQGPSKPGFSTRPTGFTPRNTTRNRGVTVEDQIRDMMNDASPEECAEIALAVHSNLKATRSTKDNKDFQQGQRQQQSLGLPRSLFPTNSNPYQHAL